MGAQTAFLRLALKAMHLTSAGALVAPLVRGLGVIFTLHHVRPGPPAAFAPNRALTITPQFLDRVIGHVLGAGYDIITLDDVPARLRQPGEGQPFACFTFDDGYRDNLDHALPIFERHGLPFAIYVTTGFADGRGDLWWLALEEAVRRLDMVEIELEGGMRRLPARSTAEKSAAFNTVYWWLRSLPEARTRGQVGALCRSAGYDPQGLSSALTLNWDEIREISRHPLATVGAHTVGHWALAKLPEAEARRQIEDSVARLEEETGRPCRHFSFPYGDAGSAGEREFEMARDAGLSTAVTTEKSLVHAHHRTELTGLPRLSLNGDYQDIAHLEVLLTGVPFAMLNAAERLASSAARVLTPRAAASSK